MDVLYEIESLTYLTDEQDIFKKLDQIQIDITEKELIKTIDYFLTHLKDHHSLSGKQFETLSGIGHWVRENNHATSKQIMYSMLTMAEHFDQLDMFK
jgi:hypothetical protein